MRKTMMKRVPSEMMKKKHSEILSTIHSTIHTDESSMDETIPQEQSMKTILESIYDCGCGHITGSLDFIRLHVETQDEAEQREALQQEHEEHIAAQAIENTQGLVRKDLLLEVN